MAEEAQGTGGEAGAVAGGSADGRELAARLGLPYLEAGAYPDAPWAGASLSVKFLRRYRCLPLEAEGSRLRVAIADPTDAATLEAIRAWTGLEADPVVGEEADILEAIERLHGSGSTTVQKIIEDMGGGDVEILSGDVEEDAEHLRDLASEAPVIRLVNLMITRAAEAGASDIHFEPFEDRLIVRTRVDGVLHEVESPPRRLQAAIVSRVKLMAKMNIAERRLPQDGRIRVRVADRGIDIRVSTVPTVFGESLVLRLLDRTRVFLDLATLGFGGPELTAFERLIRRPYGMLLVTGPTGSGKTTTLYAVLDRLNSPDKKIVTIEDPVEYQLVGVNQIQVHPKIGLTFAAGLRSIVRQDPDVILVGEIRDRETADIAIQSALTGHLVFSTLHTNDAAGAVTRLEDMGVESFLIASAVMGIIGQRLVRRVCPDCAAPAAPDPALLRSLGADAGDAGDYRAGKGCEALQPHGLPGADLDLRAAHPRRRHPRPRALARERGRHPRGGGSRRHAHDAPGRAGEGGARPDDRRRGPARHAGGIALPTFAYRATDREGKTVDGRIEAADAGSVAGRLQELGFFPLAVRPAADAAPVLSLPRLRRGGGGRRLAAFSRQLAVLLEAGIPLDHALGIAGEVADDPEFRGVIARVRRSVEEGTGLADAMARHPRTFDELYVSMVRAGEAGGALDQILKRLAGVPRGVAAHPRRGRLRAALPGVPQRLRRGGRDPAGRLRRAAVRRGLRRPRGAPSRRRRGRSWRSATSCAPPGGPWAAGSSPSAPRWPPPCARRAGAPGGTAPCWRCRSAATSR